MPNDTTVILAYYENPTMLARQYEQFREYHPKVRENLRLIIVDDGSPQFPATPEECGVPLSIYRMKVDIRWNQDACRNLGVEQAETSYVLLTDMDHLITDEAIERVVLGPVNSSRTYRFSRVSAPMMAPYKPHPNSWFMTRKRYARVGGYDERFAGWYGTDADFRDRVEAAGRIELLDEALIRVPREVIADASTTTYDRKTARDREMCKRIRDERRYIRGWRPLRLTFEWERVF